MNVQLTYTTPAGQVTASETFDSLDDIERALPMLLFNAGATSARGRVAAGLEVRADAGGVEFVNTNTCPFAQNNYR